MKNDFVFLTLIISIQKIFNKPVITYPLCVLIICLITLINGYPILYSDTSTYISSGFELETPFDRPITYGILLRIFSLNGISFLIVPVFQALIYIYVISKVAEVFIGREQKFFHTFILVLVLSIFTGFNWDLNQLIADFCTSVGFLSLICILFKNESPKKNILLFIIFFLSSASHISNVFLYFIILITAWFFKGYFFWEQNRVLKQKAIISLFLLILSYLIMASAISKSKDIFFNGSLAQKGILQQILKDKCNTEDFKLCAYKDSIPFSFEEFVWKAESPLYKLGGWKELRPELRKLSSISLSEKKYIFMQAKSTLINFSKQIVSGGIGDGNGPFGSHTILIQRIKKFAPFDASLCLSSKQAKNQFSSFNELNLFYFLSTILSVLIIFIQFYRKKMNSNVKSLTIFAFIIISANFALIAFSSEVAQRHSIKVYWLLTLIAYMVLSKSWGLSEVNRAQLRK